MCGIAGFSLKDPPPEGMLAAMTRELSHRGPDGEGYFSEGGIGLGHRRLSIIDLAGGAQPLFNEDRSVCVIYNGEIYNFREIRDDLECRGHRFTTRTDSEILVHLYEDHGPGFLNRLEGIFAFAIFDRRKRLLLLARDPVGVKPLYYWEGPKGLLFASELKAFAACPFFERRVDPAALSAYLTCEYVPGPMSIFSGTKKLLPGHCLTFESSRATIRPYWDWALPEKLPSRREECVELLRERVMESVKSQLISDVPLGVFLSGGVDSSVVTAGMRAAGQEVESFSIGFEDKSFDERLPARVAAGHLGVNHHERVFDERAMLAEIPGIFEISGEPMADPSLLPTALLSRFARERVTVALGGDGGDELFAGYPTYWVHRDYHFFETIPKPVRRAALAVASEIFPVSHKNLTFGYKLGKFADGAESPMPWRHFYWMGAFSGEVILDLLAGDPLAAPTNREWAPGWVPKAPAQDPVTAAQWLDFHTYLVEDILAKVDRASMAASLEARVPLLSTPVVRLAFSIPPQWRLEGRNGKAILKDAFARDLPAGHFDRPKKGFGIPVSAWLCGPLKPMVEDFFSAPTLGQLPFIDRQYVLKMWREHLELKRDNRKPLWVLLCLIAWWRRWRPSL